MNPDQKKSEEYPKMINSQLCGLILFPFATIGFISNWMIVVLIHRIPSLKHSFGYLSANQAIGDALHSSTFLLYVCPMLIFELKGIMTQSHHFGYILLFSYELSVHTHLIISFNRFFAVFTPYHYSSIFSILNTKIMIFLIWLLTGSLATVYYEGLCSLYYNHTTHSFVFTVSPVCDIISWYADFIKNLFVVILIAIVDILTIFKVRSIKKKISNNSGESGNNLNSVREMNFLKQAILQGVIFFVELFTYFLVPIYFKNSWIVFFGTSFAWTITHSADGIVCIFLNPELKKNLMFEGTTSSTLRNNGISLFSKLSRTIS